MSTPEQQKEMRSLAKFFEESIEIVYGKRMGFALLIFDFNSVGVSDYLANADREDMITALRECASRLESKEDIPATQGSA